MIFDKIDDLWMEGVNEWAGSIYIYLLIAKGVIPSRRASRKISTLLKLISQNFDEGIEKWGASIQS